MANHTKGLRGFALLAQTNPEKLQKICRKGGQVAHEKGTAYRWDSESAAAAGRKGGQSNSRRMRVPSPATPIPSTPAE